MNSEIEFQIRKSAQRMFGFAVEAGKTEDNNRIASLSEAFSAELILLLQLVGAPESNEVVEAHRKLRLRGQMIRPSRLRIEP